MDKVIKIIVLSIFIGLFSGCSDEDEMCEYTYQTSDGHGNYRDVTIDYPCKLGPPADAPVNGDN